MNPGISPGAVREALAAVGVRAGDVALVHSDAMVAAQFAPTSATISDEQRLDALIGALESVLGPDGTLVMPAFSYSFTKGETFDVRNTPSTVGMITERFRTRPGVNRTADPIFSLAVKGAHAAELCALPVKECFGPESAFAALHRLNCHILCVGCPFTRGGTFVHYVERSHGVDYRYDKTFSGTIVWPDGHSASASVVYYVRDLARKSPADLRRLQTRLVAHGQLKSATIGRAGVSGVRADDFFRTAWQMLEEDPVSLIEEGASST